MFANFLILRHDITPTCIIWCSVHHSLFIIVMVFNLRSIFRIMYIYHFDLLLITS